MTKSRTVVVVTIALIRATTWHCCSSADKRI